ncbi:MAG: acetylxylan esterase, partial [Phycisphaerae bacterium]|nr:acetylxylan esterase [Phycisphaerae bacterium]
MKCMILIGLIVALSAMSFAAEKVQLCRGKYHSEAAAKVQLAKFAAGYSDQASWRKRAETVRKGMLAGMGLDTPPKKCDLKPIVTGKRTHKGYTVENVAIESLPGFFVTGNLYRPI